MRKKWILKEANESLVSKLAKTLGISPIISTILINRGVKDADTAKQFLTSTLNDLHSPLLFKDMDKAILRIKEALKKEEKILLYGDYDVDGITSVVLLFSALKRFGADVDTYIPNRIKEGYGLNKEAIESAHKRGVSLLITVDCGISAHEEIDHAAELGIDTIVTDHHRIPAQGAPRAHAVINPLQEDCLYPYKGLSGVGLAYKLAQAISIDRPDYDPTEGLDLVALGTIADISPQTGENRILTIYGLKALKVTKRLGLRKMIEVAGLKKEISSYHVGYIIAPRINAMGRLGSADIAVRLLLTENEDEAHELALRLNKENKSRQGIEERILKEALAKVDAEINFKYHKSIVLGDESWHPGVLGIVASRLVDRFYRPTILIAFDGDTGKGSGRSVKNFHLFRGLNECKDLLLDFGGHAAACGVLLKKEMLENFRERFNGIVSRDLPDGDLVPTVEIDAEVSLSHLNEDLISQLERLAPFGPGNPKPVFVSRNIYLKKGPTRIGRRGVKAWVSDGSTTCEAISFREDHGLYGLENSGVDLVYLPSVNDWQGISSLQLMLEDVGQIS